MASHQVMIERRALALNELSRLSTLLADNLDIEMPDVQINHRDPQLAEIQRLENINELLTKVLQASEVETDEESLSGLTKAQLLSRAAEMKIEVNKSSSKAEIIEALEHGANG